MYLLLLSFFMFPYVIMFTDNFFASVLLTLSGMQTQFIICFNCLSYHGYLTCLLQDFYLDLAEDNLKVTPHDRLGLALRPVEHCGEEITTTNKVFLN